MALICKDENPTRRGVSFSALPWGTPFEKGYALYIKTDDGEAFDVQDCETVPFEEDEIVIVREAEIIFK